MRLLPDVLSSYRVNMAAPAIPAPKRLDPERAASVRSVITSLN